jgi:hypothetical protein
MREYRTMQLSMGTIERQLNDAARTCWRFVDWVDTYWVDTNGPSGIVRTCLLEREVES